MVICLEQGADLHVAQLMPLPLTVSCFSKIQIGFTFLVPAHLGSPRKRSVKRVCVCEWCAGDLHDCLSKLVKHEVDVASMRITLDVICLTLPQPDDTGRRSATSVSDVNRTVSLSSQLSFPGVESDLTPEIATPSKAVTAISE